MKNFQIRTIGQPYRVLSVMSGTIPECVPRTNLDCPDNVRFVWETYGVHRSPELFESSDFAVRDGGLAGPVIVAIDPGVRGAVAFLTCAGALLRVMDMPTVKVGTKTRVAPQALALLLAALVGWMALRMQERGKGITQ